MKKVPLCQNSECFKPLHEPDRIVHLLILDAQHPKPYAAKFCEECGNAIKNKQKKATP